MTTQVIRNQYNEIQIGNFCQFGVRKKTNTGGGNGGNGGGGGEIPPNEMHFTTLSGSVDYVGNQGDQILLSDGTIIDITSTDETFTFDVPSGKHKVKLVESVDRSNYVSIGGEALVELHNFPTLSVVNVMDFCPNATSPNLVKVPNVLPSNITSLAYMFSDAIAFNQPLNSWNVSSVTSMNTMFYGTTTFNQDISMWDVSNVTNMNAMFQDATAFNQDLSQWCVGLITSLPFEFDLRATNWTLPKPIWGTCPVKPEDGEMPSNEMHFTTTEGVVDYVGTQGDQILLSDGTIIDVTITDDTFTFDVPSGKHKVKLVESIGRSNYVSVGGEALVELHNFPALSTVTKFNFLTYNYSDLSNLTKVPEFFPSNITDIENLFYYATNFNQDISMWDVSNVTNMNAMFSNATAFNQDISNWDVSKVTNTALVFSYAIAFNQDLSQWNVSNVTEMSFMFKGAIAFNQDISSWNVSNVTNMNGMFDGASAFNQDLSQWCVSNITNPPLSFDPEAANWTLPRPVWGTCPV